MNLDTYEAAIGYSVREAREAVGMSHHEVAREMESLGFSWSDEVVQAVEAGERPILHSEARFLKGITGFDLGSPPAGDLVGVVTVAPDGVMTYTERGPL